jgi:triosephosphate isomerase (TIM)
MRRAVIAGNWKLHKTIAETRELVLALKTELAELNDIDIVVAPPFTALHAAAQALETSSIAVAAQNCYPVANGAFTGEVSPPLLREAGCKMVLVGHSERRQLFGESDAFINAKVRAALEAGLQPIFCIGETLEEREGGRMYDVLTRQLKEGLAGIEPGSMAQVIIAYEPVWAIGTGRTASNEQAAEAHAFIRGLIQGLYDESIAQDTRILYGGSVKPDNVDGLMAQEDIDGTLVGGASLKAADFIRIARFQRS